MDELLDLMRLKRTTTGKDIFEAVSAPMDDMGLPLAKLFGITTDGPPAVAEEWNEMAKVQCIIDPLHIMACGCLYFSVHGPQFNLLKTSIRCFLTSYKTCQEQNKQSTPRLSISTLELQCTKQLQHYAFRQPGFCMSQT